MLGLNFLVLDVPNRSQSEFASSVHRSEENQNKSGVCHADNECRVNCSYAFVEITIMICIVVPTQFPHNAQNTQIFCSSTRSVPFSCPSRPMFGTERSYESH